MTPDRPLGLLRAADHGAGRATRGRLPRRPEYKDGHDWGVAVTVFGDQLRNHRLRAVLTQEELADRTGLSVRALGKLESGATNRPRPVTVRLLTDALELSEPERTSFNAAAFDIRPLHPVPPRRGRVLGRLLAAGGSGRDARPGEATA
jgi:transcriptional regulator with XRE-family HTH domain